MIKANQQPVIYANDQIADLLDETAELLETQGANQFRVRAYRNAAETLRKTLRPVSDILSTDGLDGLKELAGVGDSLARSIQQLAKTGKFALLERLRGDLLAERLFETVPGIGHALATRIHDELGIESLAELQAAASDGRLGKIPGMGQRRVQAVRESLAGRFQMAGTASKPRPESPAENEPPVAELLEIDREYRAKAAADRLPRIAPRRFNPTHQAWLPIFHTEYEDRHYTALFSNTARAHELGTTNDWVVIYRDDHRGAGQWTVITARMGKLKGQRIVRGREPDCVRYYAELEKQTADFNDFDSQATGKVTT